METQMTADKAGASIYAVRQWNSIKWKEAERQVRRLQMRIAKIVIPGYAFIRRSTVGPPPKGCL
jgi:hypothetical protein